MLWKKAKSCLRFSTVYFLKKTISGGHWGIKEGVIDNKLSQLIPEKKG